MKICITELEELPFYKQIKSYFKNCTKTEDDKIDIYELISLIEKRKDLFFHQNLCSQKLYKAFKLTGVSNNFIEEKDSKEPVCIVCNYKNGKLDGDYSQFYSNGTLWLKTNYKDNKLDGEHTLFYKYRENDPYCLSAPRYKKSLIQKKSNFKNGKLHGLSETFSRSGVLLTSQMFDNGILIDL
jgi:antitoxin component YwqK of YwqJK toxin-antitoxin module